MNITAIPDALNSQLFGGTNLVAAQLLVTAMVVMAFCLPAMMVKSKGNAIIIMAIFGVFLCTALQWIDGTIAMFFIIAVALLGAVKAAAIFGS